MNVRRVLLWLDIPFIFSILIPGLSFHLWYIFDPFTRGEVISNVSEELPLKIRADLGFNFCSKVKNFTTVADAFKNSPPPSAILDTSQKWCGLLLCQHLVPRNYFYNGYMCYVTEFVNTKARFNTRGILAAHGEKALIEYRVNANLFDSDHFIAFMADFDQPALKYFEGKVLKLSPRSGISFTMSTHTSTKIKLPGYDGDCFDYSKVTCGDSWICNTECMNNYTRTTYNQTWPTLTIYQPSDQVLFNFNLTGKMMKEYKQAAKNCNELYPPKPCKYHTIYTEFYEDTKEAPDGLIIFTWEISNQPNRIVQDVPRVPVVELFSFVLGSIGIWLSLGILSFFPTATYDYVRDEGNRMKFKEICDLIMFMISTIVFCTLKTLFIFFVRAPLTFLKRCRNCIRILCSDPDADAVHPFQHNP